MFKKTASHQLRRILLSLFLFLVFIAISEQYTLRLQKTSSDHDDVGEAVRGVMSKRQVEEESANGEEAAAADTTTDVVDNGTGDEKEEVVPEDRNDSTEAGGDQAEETKTSGGEEEGEVVDTTASSPVEAESNEEEEKSAAPETTDGEVVVVATTTAAETQQEEEASDAQIEADETQNEATTVAAAAEDSTETQNDNETDESEQPKPAVPETASAALASALTESVKPQVVVDSQEEEEASTTTTTGDDEGSGEPPVDDKLETTTEVDQIVVSPEDNLPTDGVDEYTKENNVTAPPPVVTDTEGSGSAEYDSNKDFDPKGKGGELPSSSEDDDDEGSGDEEMTHEPVTTEKPEKDLEEEEDEDEGEKKNVWFKPSVDFVADEGDQYLENMRKCPSLQCEYGFRIDSDERPNCDCYNPCNEINCGSDVCIVEQTGGNNKFKGVCYTKEVIDQKVKDGKPLHCHKPRPKPEVCRRKHYTSRFFYNITGSRCEHFVYTSCTADPDVNKYENHFLTWETCQMECHTCSLPAERGPCKANVLRYFYDPASKECKGFSWGGCQGNENNFATRRHCEDSCVRRVEGALFLNGMPVRKIRIYNSGGDIFNKKN